jgi:two-component system, OmpR family, sensor histidine kinase VicK
MRLNKQQFNLSDMILNCISDFRNQIKNENRDSNLKLEVLFSSDEGAKTNEEDVIIEADRNRLYQVVSNLLSNAIKFTKEGAIVVSIEIRAEGKTKNSDNDESGVDVVISVKDTGVGIDSEVLPRLFMKFITKSETGGTGLGLFISKSIEAHGGRIWAKNNNDGKGATFAFSLPIVNK